ncbi:MAG: aminomethyl-transferring glycine dehydrogenase subunit GcvPA [Acidobacteria bacterium]|nr:MAG: aminomethyl-transferring glycine dehydrogenase subunit GcvPA [Acidobacteriota bacterium]
MRYIPNSLVDRQSMLAEIGLDSIEQLFSGIPEKLGLRRLLNIPGALTEPELVDYFRQRAAQNAADCTSFLGAGVYRHYIPIIIDALISRSEFYTAYTPYQAEIAQGTLQAIFEFQTYITQLTGMEVSNASLYDGSTGLAEAVLMAHRINKKDRFLVAKTVHPEYRAVINTYTKNLGIHIELIDYTADGRIDLKKLASAIGTDAAAVVIQSPNFFGTIEKTHDISELAHKFGALSIVNISEAMSLGILKPPGEDTLETRMADIVAGEAQSLGVPMSFGGPHLGFLATRERFVRQMPGRLVGMGMDHSGRRGFVLTLSTREQHIRREKATSNICTNQSLCALMATIYLAIIGPKAFREICEQNILKTKYAVQQIQTQTKHRVLFPAPRFNEFVVELVDDYRPRVERLMKNNIVPGISLSRFYPELGNAILLCVTEITRKEQIDKLVEGLA